MSEGVHANFEALEGTVSTEITLTLNRKSRKIAIINDSASNNLLYKFNASESFGTLMPTESLSIYLTTNQVILDSTSAAYRVWAYG